MSVLVLRVSCLTLFNLQGARLRASQSPASAQLLYHSFRSLSRTFFIFFQVLFLAHPLSGTAARDSFDRIPLYPSFVKGFFEVFSFFLEKAKIRRIPPLPRFVKHFFHLFALFSFFPCFSPFLHILPHRYLFNKWICVPEKTMVSYKLYY